MRRITTDRARLAGERGMTAVWVALMLVVLMLFAALAIDGGQAYSSRRQSQNASDAGVMAGIRQLVEIRFPAPDVTPPTTDTLAQQVLNQAHNSGADTDADGVECYVVDRAEARLTGDLCAGGTALTFTPTSAMVGVEVLARQTKETNFGRVVGIDNTSARTSAVAMIQNYENPNGSPFVVCGSRDDMATWRDQQGNGWLESNPGNTVENWSYDLLAKDTTTNPATYTLNESAIDKYYVLQASRVPSCGNTAADFKGLLDRTVAIRLFEETGTGQGNASNGEVTDIVLGIDPCTPEDIEAREFDECGLLIPLSAYNAGNGQNTTSFPVIWTVWEVTGGQGANPATFNSIGGSGYGEGCRDPISAFPEGAQGNPTSGMKYCGRLLGSIQLSGGEGGEGPLNRGAIVIKLVK